MVGDDAGADWAIQVDERSGGEGGGGEAEGEGEGMRGR